MFSCECTHVHTHTHKVSSVRAIFGRFGLEICYSDYWVVRAGTAG